MPVTETVTDPGPKANEMVGGVGGAWFGGRGAGAAVVTAAGAVGARVGEAAAPGRGGGELGASEGRLASTWLHPHIARRTANPTVAGNLSTAFLLCITEAGNESGAVAHAVHTPANHSRRARALQMRTT